MDRNNAILFTFGTIFLLLGFFSPIIRGEFENTVIENNQDIFEETGQQDINSSTAIDFLSAVFFWVIGAPLLLNIILTMMRVIFWVIVWDKLPFT